MCRCVARAGRGGRECVHPIAYFQLVGQIDTLARILLNAACVFALLVLVQMPRFRDLPFALSWSALSFPVAALSIASLLHARVAASPAHLAIGLVVLGLLCLAIAGLVARTFVAILRGEICRPE